MQSCMVAFELRQPGRGVHSSLQVILGCCSGVMSTGVALGVKRDGLHRVAHDDKVWCCLITMVVVVCSDVWFDACAAQVNELLR